MRRGNSQWERNQQGEGVGGLGRCKSMIRGQGVGGDGGKGVRGRGWWVWGGHGEGLSTGKASRGGKKGWSGAGVGWRWVEGGRWVLGAGKGRVVWLEGWGQGLCGEPWWLGSTLGAGGTGKPETELRRAGLGARSWVGVDDGGIVGGWEVFV